MTYKMNGFSGFGNSPLHDHEKDKDGKVIKHKKSDLYVTGTDDQEGNFAQDTSFLPKDTEYKEGEDLDETDFEEQHPELAETNIIQDVSNVKKTTPKLNLKLNKEDWMKHKSK